MEKLVQALGVTSPSKSQVSIMGHDLDKQVEAFRTRARCEAASVGQDPVRPADTRQIYCSAGGTITGAWLVARAGAPAATEPAEM